MALGNNTYVHDFRGTDELYVAAVTKDNNEVGEGYVTGTVFKLAPTANISKTTENASATKFYDNAPAFTINAQGADTLTIQVPALSIANLAAITGKSYDAATGAMSDDEGTAPYFALGYRLGLTDGTYRYVWRYKGTFAVPDEEAATKDAGTDSNGQTLTYTGISTIHKFTKTNDVARALVVDERDNKAVLTTFFDAVTTIDTLTAKV